MSSFRFTAEGDLDDQWGTNGVTYLDVGGYSDNGRFVMVLPGDRILGAGAGRPKPATPPAEGENPERDAMVTILTAAGLPDTSYGPDGFELFDLGGDGDHFWGGAVSPDGSWAAVVGIAGAEAEGEDNDSAVYLLELQ